MLGINKNGEVYTLYFNSKFEYKNINQDDKIIGFLKEMGQKYSSKET